MELILLLAPRNGLLAGLDENRFLKAVLNHMLFTMCLALYLLPRGVEDGLSCVLLKKIGGNFAAPDKQMLHILELPMPLFLSAITAAIVGLYRRILLASH